MTSINFGWLNKALALFAVGDMLSLNSSKLNIIEQEFKYAEKTEFWRMKEEEEMRRTIQVWIILSSEYN